MVEHGVMVEYDSGMTRMASSDPPSASSLDYYLYPPPMATYEEVVASPQCFFGTLQKLHASMRTKFRIPIIGGQELDLHRLFIVVTSRGGVMKILQEKKWKDVTSVFSFPASATNASFILRKYYFKLIFHYEQVYFFKARSWSKNGIDFASGTSLGVPMGTVPSHASAEPELSSLAIQAARREEQGQKFVDPFPGGSSGSSLGSTVHGVIDGKFESGYLITVMVGSEKLKGILYQTPLDMSNQEQHHQNIHQYQSTPINENYSLTLAPRVSRRRRRAKSKIRRRDPAHPKPNRSGYNFFFGEHHVRLKQLYPGKDKAVSRIVGESWNKLTESEKAIYQEKAAKDKERYRKEMQVYRERLRAGQTAYTTVPIQQYPHSSYPNFTEMQKEQQAEGANSFQALMTEHLETDFNSMESDDKLQSDEENSGSTFGDEHSSNTSEESEPDLSTSQIISNASPMQERFHPLEADTNMRVKETTSNRGDSSHLDMSAVPLNQKPGGASYAPENERCINRSDADMGNNGRVGENGSGVE